MRHHKGVFLFVQDWDGRIKKHEAHRNDLTISPISDSSVVWTIRWTRNKVLQARVLLNVTFITAHLHRGKLLRISPNFTSAISGLLKKIYVITNSKKISTIHFPEIRIRLIIGRIKVKWKVRTFIVGYLASYRSERHLRASLVAYTNII